ncbi:MAG: rRNA maturation RNase YbeY [Xanthomonadales bacterium]|nr:rRNA maturation RNase YbeY [Xanthomonadales bacterium]
MSIELCLQNVSSVQDIPNQSEFEQWLHMALQGMPEAVLTIRIVDEDESAVLNQQYRQKTCATNVLSFPADLPEEVELPLLGDLVICAPLVQSEANVQGKSVTAHWAHLVIHGTLHLLGYDHIEEAEAAAMENLETRLLQQLGIADPYA